MAHHRDPRAVLDIPDEGVTPSRDNQINVLIQGQERSYFSSGLNRLNILFRNSSLRDTSQDCGRQEQGRSI